MVLFQVPARSNYPLRNADPKPTSYNSQSRNLLIENEHLQHATRQREDP